MIYTNNVIFFTQTRSSIQRKRRDQFANEHKGQLAVLA